jgi:hypothetical protein
MCVSPDPQYRRQVVADVDVAPPPRTGFVDGDGDIVWAYILSEYNAVYDQASDLEFWACKKAPSVGSEQPPEDPDRRMMDPEVNFIRTCLHVRVLETWALCLTDHVAVSMLTSSILLVTDTILAVNLMHPNPRAPRSFSAL